MNCAVGNTDTGLLEIQHSASDDCNSIIGNEREQKNTDTNTIYTVSHNICFSVPARTLDSIAGEHNWPNCIRLIKIDTEGYELFVLEGAREVLKKTELVYFEFWEALSNKFGYSWSDLFHIFDASGFQLYCAPEIDSAGNVIWPTSDPLDASADFDKLRNFIGLNVRLAPQIRTKLVNTRHFN